MTPSNSIFRIGEGTPIVLPAPLAGELILAHGVAGAVTTALQTLQPGATFPTHRSHFVDRVVFLHKGQARVQVGTQSLTAVPGALIAVPHGSWFSLRNNGTGVLELAWTGFPAGLERFFEELAQHQGTIDGDALKTLGHRFGLEFQDGQPLEAPAPSTSDPKRRRRRGRGRGRHHGGHEGGPAHAETGSAAAQPAAHAAPQAASPTASAPAAPVRKDHPRGGRRHRPRSGNRGGASSAPTTGNTTINLEPGQSAAGSSGSGGKVREVYMGGRWVQVTGEGPVVYPGREFFRRGKKRERDDDSPSGPLSVVP